MKKFILLAAAAATIAVPAYAAPGDRNGNRAHVQKVQKAQKAQKRVIKRTVNRTTQVRNVYRQPVQVRNVYRQPVQQVRVQSGRYHQWSRGQRFDRRYASNYQVIGNYDYYRLNAPPRGYHYVRSGNDIILVAIASGIIGAVFASSSKPLQGREGLRHVRGPSPFAPVLGKGMTCPACPHLLLVDDERDIRDPLCRLSRRRTAMRVTKAENAAAARQVLAAHAIDLVLLDIMMPGEDGLSLAGFVRATSGIPVILLTAKAEETDRIVGLELGADDYVTKPFSPARAARPDQGGAAPDAGGRAGGPRAGCRRASPSGRGCCAPASASWSTPTGVATPLSTGEYNLLLAFVTHPQRVLTPRPVARPQPEARAGRVRAQHRQSYQPPAAQDRGRSRRSRS